MYLVGFGNPASSVLIQWSLNYLTRGGTARLITEGQATSAGRAAGADGDLTSPRQ